MHQFLRSHQPIFSDEPTDLVSFGFAVATELCPDAMYGLDILLGNSLNGNEAHVGPAHRFADRLCIIGVVLVALDVRLHKLRRDQADLIAHGLQASRPIMSATAGLHADLTTRFSDFTNSINPVCTTQLLPPHRLLKTIYAVYLKHVLCQIDSNADNFMLDLSSLLIGFTHFQSGTRCRLGEEGSIPLLVAGFSIPLPARVDLARFNYLL